MMKTKSQIVFLYLPYKETPEKATDNAKEEEGNEFKEEPGFVVLHIEEDTVFITEGVDGLKNKSSNQSTKKGSPECLQGKIVTDFFQAKKHTSNGSTKCDRDAGGRGGG